MSLRLGYCCIKQEGDNGPHLTGRNSSCGSNYCCSPYIPGLLFWAHISIALPRALVVVWEPRPILVNKL